MKCILAAVLAALMLLAGCSQPDRLQNPPKPLMDRHPTVPSLRLMPEKPSEISDKTAFPCRRESLIVLPDGFRPDTCRGPLRLMRETEGELLFSGDGLEIFLFQRDGVTEIEIWRSGQKNPQRIHISSEPLEDGRPLRMPLGRPEQL